MKLMKKLILFVILIFSTNKIEAQVKVNGYYRKNGTYVEPYYRSSPDKSPYNNYSYPGNINPYTGKVATGDSDKYLEKYNSTRSSGFYPSYIESNRIEGNTVYTIDLGYQLNTYAPLGGYLIFNINNVSLGTEIGKIPNDEFGYYWTGFIGIKGFYGGLGEYQYSPFAEYDLIEESEILYSFGYHSAYNHLSFKIGGIYSPKTNIQGSLGIGLKIF
jgi:hypothetical protein